MFYTGISRTYTLCDNRCLLPQKANRLQNFNTFYVWRDLSENTGKNISVSTQQNNNNNLYGKNFTAQYTGKYNILHRKFYRPFLTGIWCNRYAICITQIK